MISRMEGELLSVSAGRALIACGNFTYEVFVPGADEQRLNAMTGQAVELYTLHYLESQGPAGPFVPRLIGFRSAEDRAFFELFTTVKGMGNRKALRALQLPFRDVAAAIAQRDTDLLTSLPEIGKRTAETIVAELKGKVDRFVEIKSAAAHDGTDAGPRFELMRDALAVLVQLGEARATARQLIERALAADPSLAAADQVVAAAYRLKEL